MCQNFDNCMQNHSKFHRVSQYRIIVKYFELYTLLRNLLIYYVNVMQGNVIMCA